MLHGPSNKCTSGSLDEGEVTAVGNGFETDYSRAATWFFFGNRYLYRLSYNMGSDGTTVAFYLGNDGRLHQRSGEYSIQNFTAYGTYGNKIITTATAAGNTSDAYGNKAYGINFTLLDVENETTETKTINADMSCWPDCWKPTARSIQVSFRSDALPTEWLREL